MIAALTSVTSFTTAARAVPAAGGCSTLKTTIKNAARATAEGSSRATRRVAIHTEALAEEGPTNLCESGVTFALVLGRRSEADQRVIKHSFVETRKTGLACALDRSA